VEGVEQRPRIAHGLAEEFVVRVAELAFRVAGLEVGLAAVDREPVGMLREDFLAVRHVRHAVGDLQALVIANAEAHDPQRGFRPAGGKAEVELPQRKVRLHGFVEFRQLDGLHRRQHLAEFARQIPACAEPVQKRRHRIEAAAFVEAPEFERFAIKRDFAAVLVQTGSRQPIRRSDDLFPLGLRSRDVAIVFAKGPTGSKSASSPISASQSAPLAMR
jgi:hypothetical protein